MRLLQTDSNGVLRLVSVSDSRATSYAILSHTWAQDDSEVTFEDIEDGTAPEKAGYYKLRFCAEQAKRDGLEYFWVDTCCIKKSDLAELAEAITSMFRWYSHAKKCYVLLSDVSSRKRDYDGAAGAWEESFRSSRWFKRGWTLQELLAPRIVEFFSRNGDRLGDKSSLEQEIHAITKIPVAALRGEPVSRFQSSQIMQWASQRHTKKEEDQAYCLAGIFGVSVRPNYGEGRESAMRHLKSEIANLAQSQLHEAQAPISQISEESARDRRRRLLDSLKSEAVDARRFNIGKAHSGTCKWLLGHPLYSDWTNPLKVEERRGFLWIRGKPGAGKSTIMKFAQEHATKHKLDQEIVISFFFNARGEDLEKTTRGMWISLLAQLLETTSDLQAVLDTVAFPSNHDQDSPHWTENALQEIFEAAVLRLGSRRLKCFIDALDECEEQQIRKMVDFFQDLGESAVESHVQFHVCFASRHYPTISIQHGLNMILESEQGHGDDLAKYVRTRLNSVKSKAADSVRDEILRKANGVFMWVVLVIPLLKAEFDNGRIFNVKNRLKEIPRELGELFREIMRRDNANMDEMLLCFQWILLAARPLGMEEFYFAMVAGLDPASHLLRKWDLEEVDADAMRQYVTSSSKDLAELTRSKPTVQFIHESVRDFLLKDDGLRKLWPDLTNDFPTFSHERLGHCCEKYLEVMRKILPTSNTLEKASSEGSKTLRTELKTTYPFLDYASHQILYHAERSAEESQDLFLANFHRESWINITNMLALHETKRHTPAASLLYVLAENNCANLIRNTCRGEVAIGERGERYHYPFIAALANGHLDVARALLQIDKECSPKSDSTNFKLPFRKDHTPLLWAIEAGSETIAEALLNTTEPQEYNARLRDGRSLLALAVEKGYDSIVVRLLESSCIKVDRNDPRASSPLVYAVRHGHESIVRLLLDHGADVDYMTRPFTHSPVLVEAIALGHDAIVRMLLDRDPDLEKADPFGVTALRQAARHGRLDIIGILVKKGACLSGSVNRPMRDSALSDAARAGHTSCVQLLVDSYGHVACSEGMWPAALRSAAAERHDAIVDLLLERGVEIESMVGGHQRTRLHLAASAGITTTMASLMDSGTDIEQCDDLGHRPIHAAAMAGHEKAVQLLLDHGANTETTDGLQVPDRALSYVAMKGHKQCVRLLLHWGAHVDDTDHLGFTALANAAHRGHVEILQLLLNDGATIDAQHQKLPPLVSAADHGYRDCVKLLLDAGANIEAIGYGRARALMQAAAGGHREVVSLLLDHNANIEAKDAEGRTALLSAAAGGQKDCVRLLLDRGADPEVIGRYGDKLSDY